jgi:hypothetical protein
MKFKMMWPGYFVAFITALVEEYSDKLIAGMVTKGYTVSAVIPGDHTAIAVEGGASALIVFNLYTGKDGVTCDTIHTELIDLIQEERMYVYSVVVSERSPAAFAGTNIITPKKAQPPALPPIPSEAMRKMN